MNKNITKQTHKNKKTEIKENITIDKAQLLYQKYSKTMKILEDK